jgi:2'-5' RNA ligase
VADPPHVTLLFLGRIKGTHVVQFQTALDGSCPRHFDMETAGLGTFGKNGRVTNLHIRLAASVPFMDAHRVLLDKAKEFEWFSAGAYAGVSYTPHVSIYRSIDLAVEEADWMIRGRRWNELRFRLGDPHIRAVPTEFDNWILS